MSDFKPFENDSQSTTVGPGDGVTFENGKDSISIYGDYEITKKTKPEEIDELINMLNNIKNALVPKDKKQLKS